jgi:hypothetical protein
MRKLFLLSKLFPFFMDNASFPNGLSLSGDRYFLFRLIFRLNKLDVCKSLLK